MMMHDRPTTICLINGQKFAYDLADSNRDCKSARSDIYEYLGEGTIYSVNGAVQKPTCAHFWVKKSK